MPLARAEKPWVPPHEGEDLNTMKSLTKKRVAGLAAVAAIAASVMAGSAHADPSQFSALVGVGSDTVQDVANAFAGQSNGVYYKAIDAGDGNHTGIASFDAFPNANLTDQCITTKLNGPTFTRPQGSGAGQKALSDSYFPGSGATWLGTTFNSPIYGVMPTCTTAAVSISGQVDFARSSSKGTDTGAKDLAFIPFGRDGVSFAYYRAAGSPQTTLTQQELNWIWTHGPTIKNGVRIVPCGIQSSSGTSKFWEQSTSTGTKANSAVGFTAGECTPTAATRLPENDGNSLKQAGAAVAALGTTTGLTCADFTNAANCTNGSVNHANDEVVVGFSAAQYTSQANGAATSTIPATANFGIGSISDNGSGTNLGSPVSVSGGVTSPSASFYGDSVFGRNVFFVIPYVIATATAGFNDSRGMFVNANYANTSLPNTAAVCNANTTLNKFGFLATSSCGNPTISWSPRQNAPA